MPRSACVHKEGQCTSRLCKLCSTCITVTVQVENQVITSPGYNDYCMLDTTGSANNATAADMSCAQPMSPLALFFGPAMNGSGFPAIVLNQTYIDAVLTTVSRNVYVYGTMLDRSFYWNNLESAWTRSMYYFGTPVKGYSAADTKCGARLLGSSISQHTQ
jgi:hypothetical protein